jgi:hypothetical protein
LLKDEQSEVQAVEFVLVLRIVAKDLKP